MLFFRCTENKNENDKQVQFLAAQNSCLELWSRDGRGSYFFHGLGRGGEGQGQKSMGRGGAGNPPFSTARGGAGKGSKSAGLGGAGAGNCVY